MPTVHLTPEDGTTVALPLHEVESLVGQRFAGAWWRVDAATQRPFEESTYLDRLPNPWAPGAFPSRLIEGFHLLALLDYMLNALLCVRGPDAHGVNYGFEKVRFVSPVTFDDEIRLTGSVREVRPKGSGFLVLLGCVVEVRGREQPGCVADWWVYWLSEPPFASEER